MKLIDQKYSTDGEAVIKTATGERIPDDEPMFLFRARDYLALPMLQEYRDLCAADGCTDYQLEGIDAALLRFEEFAQKNPDRMKQPGITKGR